MMTTKHTLAGLVLLSGITLASTGQAQDTVTLRLHHFAAPTTPVQTQYLEPWAKRIEEQSDGAIKVEIFPAMQLGGSASSLYDQAKDGVVDIAWTLLSYTPNRFPESEAFDQPFLPTTGEATSMAAQEFAMEHMQDDFEGVHPLAVFAHSPGKLHTKDVSVHDIDDIDGLAIRAPSKTMNRYFTRLGAKSVGMPMPQIPEAISRGVIDGLTLPFESASALGVLDVAQNHTFFDGENGLYTAMMVLAMNQDKYDSLSPELQEVIDNNAGIQEAQQIGHVMDEAEQAAIDDIAARGEGQMIHIAEANQDKWKAAADKTIDEWIAGMDEEGYDGQQLYDDASQLVEKYTKQTQ
ncbi:TRAP transporter substrate-binding protein [Chromohalobacter canadensis]|uniref:TRAP transporter substrate-binding protein n=1 Tax=Chromohalobacter canadensis TaxID=141389 RepID=UPI0021C0B61A|nr:TRAP transporter substrate-binding protein [Chromohalobacter canadensis]MCT8468860.1 TRAP transporter substrate-binding protein [Chromohalobacter canadensis]MCT8472950.1 TRAP transporter substrate-binding protein [Chromohalobacter canadensis]MCT8500402.1 TRAP transporter substrate-binding protein [Chromohalobacter canadensis]